MSAHPEVPLSADNRSRRGTRPGSAAARPSLAPTCPEPGSPPELRSGSHRRWSYAGCPGSRHSAAGTAEAPPPGGETNAACPINASTSTALPLAARPTASSTQATSSAPVGSITSRLPAGAQPPLTGSVSTSYRSRARSGRNDTGAQASHWDPITNACRPSTSSSIRQPADQPGTWATSVASLTPRMPTPHRLDCPAVARSRGLLRPRTDTAANHDAVAPGVMVSSLKTPAYRGCPLLAAPNGGHLDRCSDLALLWQRRAPADPSGQQRCRSALVAQGIERWFPKPCAAGSNPAEGTRGPLLHCSRSDR